MKIQKFKREIRGKIYYQYMVTIPPNLVKALKLEGKELQLEINKNGRLEFVEKTESE